MAQTPKNETPVRETSREEGSRPRPVFTPAKHLLNDHQKMARSKNITIGVLLAGLVLVWMAISSSTGEKQILVIDPVGGVTQGPLEPLAGSKGFFSITSINATQAALQRSSIGFDLQDAADLFFGQSASYARRKSFRKPRGYPPPPA